MAGLPTINNADHQYIRHHHITFRLPPNGTAAAAVVSHIVGRFFTDGQNAYVYSMHEGVEGWRKVGGGPDKRQCLLLSNAILRICGEGTATIRPSNETKPSLTVY